MEAAALAAFDGMAGCVYGDLLMSRALGIAPSPAVANVLQKIRDGIRHDLVFDIIGGAAGALLVSLRAREYPAFRDAATECAHACAARLIEGAELLDDGATWKSPVFGQPLSGLAHGSCGIGLALGEYAAAFDDEAARELAQRAFDYAGARADPQTGLWRDLRAESGGMIAWCHGAGGIVLARQRYLELFGRDSSESVRNDVEKGLNLIRGPGGPKVDTLCHGRAGNWEALWRGSAADRQAADAETALLCADWFDGIAPACDLSVPTPDLMNGLAGVGLQILRSIDPNTPCVAILGA